jgi:hypothetical protein
MISKVIRDSREINSLLLFNSKIPTVVNLREVVYGHSSVEGCASEYEVEDCTLEINSNKVPLQILAKSIMEMEISDADVRKFTNSDRVIAALLSLHRGEIGIKECLLQVSGYDRLNMIDVIDSLCVDGDYSDISYDRYDQQDGTVVNSVWNIGPYGPFDVPSPELFCVAFGRWRIISVLNIMASVTAMLDGHDITPVTNIPNLLSLVDGSLPDHESNILHTTMKLLGGVMNVLSGHVMDRDEYFESPPWCQSDMRDKVWEQAISITNGDPRRVLNLRLITGNPEHECVSLPHFDLSLIRDCPFHDRKINLDEPRLRPLDMTFRGWDDIEYNLPTYYAMVYMIMNDCLQYYNIDNINRMGITEEFEEMLAERCNISNLNDVAAVHSLRKKFMPIIKEELAKGAAESLIYQPGSRWVSSAMFERGKENMIAGSLSRKRNHSAIIDSDSVTKKRRTT